MMRKPLELATKYNFTIAVFEQALSPIGGAK